MITRKITRFFLAVFLTAAMMTGCGGSGGKTPEVGESKISATADPASHTEVSSETEAGDAGGTEENANAQTRTVTDVLGREVTIPASLRTVACPGLPSTRMVVYSGALDRIAGVTENEKMELVCAPCSDVFHDLFTQLPTIGSGWPNSEIYQEELILLDPDAVVLFTSDPSQADELQEQTGLPVLAVTATDFVDQDFADTMRFLGDVFGTSQHTDELLNYVEECRKDLDSRTKEIPEKEKPTVYYGAVSFRGYNGLDATYAHYNPFEVIHARNVADETGGSGAMTVDLEQVAEWDPDILFINQEPPTLEILRTDFSTNPDFYRGLSAVKNGKVYGQAAYNCVYTNIELSLINAYYAGTIIYPDQFADLDFEKKADEILTMFEGEKGPGFISMMEEAGLGWHQVTLFE